MLQWGRCRSAAEMLSTLLKVYERAKLQWGRCRSAAEMLVPRREILPWWAGLQWGRCRSAAEMKLSPRIRLTGKLASMGPLPIGSGNDGEPRRAVDFPLDASMGPLPIGSGNAGNPMSCQAHLLASMGPLPIGSGNGKHTLGVILFPYLLQWGRCRSAAEINYHEILARFVSQLQWGRCRSAAEIVSSPTVATHSTARFNGAAADRQRKYCRRVRLRLWQDQLQWGRCRSAAEMRSSRMPWRNAAEGLQWGRCRSAAEIRV